MFYIKRCDSLVNTDYDSIIMAQVKKTAVRDAILKSAFRLFSRQGYERTTLAQIAAGARVSTANVYVYFASKLEVLYAIYDPWLRERLTLLAEQLERVRDPHRRLSTLLEALWRDIPAERNGFANNVMQAASTATPEEGYNPTLLLWVEENIAAMIRDALPPARRDELGGAPIAHILMMAFDGFVINYHLQPGKHCGRETIELMCQLLLGVAPTPSRRRRRT
jgi:AcrR family transcriptional regulator